MSPQKLWGIHVLGCLLLITLSTQPVWAMGLESFGPAGEHFSRAADWPKGVEDVLRHSSRVYWNWVNGNERAYYFGDLQTINELLQLFAKTDLNVHEVIVLPGRPSAKSFHGQLTPYAVEFELPSGIYLHHAEELAATGLYSVMPRMTIYLDDKLVKRAGELKMPVNVSLRDCAFRIEDALSQMTSADRSLQSHAIAMLGKAGSSSPAVLESLTRASKGEDEFLRKAAKTALEQVEAENEPGARALRQRVAEFVRNHPQAAKLPTPDALLKALRDVDAQFAKGCTASGTMSRPARSGPSSLFTWNLTMGNDRLVIEERAVEDETHPQVAGRFENTIYVGPDRMAMFHRERIWADGKLIDAAPYVHFEPPGSTYDLLIGRLLWPLGRRFSQTIDQITDIAAAADGTLLVKANGRNMRWELTIAPDANYLVRAARGFRGDQSAPSCTVDNAGLQGNSDLYLPHTARWTEGASAHPISISVTSIWAKTDVDLIRQVENQLDQLPALPR